MCQCVWCFKIWLITQERIWNLRWLKAWNMHTRLFKRLWSSGKTNLLGLFKFSFIPSTTVLHNYIEKNLSAVLSPIVLLQYHFCGILSFTFPLVIPFLGLAKSFHHDVKQHYPLPSSPALPLIYLCCEVSKTPRPGSGGELADLPCSSPQSFTISEPRRGWTHQCYPSVLHLTQWVTTCSRICW